MISAANLAPERNTSTRRCAECLPGLVAAAARAPVLAASPQYHSPRPRARPRARFARAAARRIAMGPYLTTPHAGTGSATAARLGATGDRVAVRRSCFGQMHKGAQRPAPLRPRLCVRTRVAHFATSASPRRLLPPACTQRAHACITWVGPARYPPCPCPSNATASSPPWPIRARQGPKRGTSSQLVLNRPRRLGTPLRRGSRAKRVVVPRQRRRRSPSYLPPPFFLCGRPMDQHPATVRASKRVAVRA